MTTADIIATCRTNSELRFLVIGGLAVIAHGYPRHTMDLDYLVRRSDRDAWHHLLARHNYEPTHEHENFTQFTSRADWMDLDLMFVNDATFETMFAASELKSLGAVDARFPSLPHLIALKLHVIKQNIPHRILGDMDDVINLLLANKVDVRQESWRQKSATPSPPDTGLYLHEQAGGPQDLELPDAADFISKRTPLTLAQFMPLLEEHRKSFNVGMRQASRRRPVTAEFIL